MKLIEAYAALRQLNLPAISTKDVAAYLKINTNYANKLLSRIAQTKQIIRIRQGTWAFPDLEPLILPSLLTDTFPAYISLQTALYYHGMISQIPDIIYAVSPARTRVYRTPIATVSIHHVQPSFFFGYTEKNSNGLLKIATPEKALIDLLYLSPAKSRLFSSLPELELPKKFDFKLASRMIRQISAPGRRTVVQQRFSEYLENRRML